MLSIGGVFYSLLGLVNRLTGTGMFMMRFKIVKGKIVKCSALNSPQCPCKGHYKTTCFLPNDKVEFT